MSKKKKNGLIVTYDEDGNAIEIHPEVDTDTTLTKSNVAADAYEVGAKFKEISDSIDSTKESLQSEIDAVSSIAKGANQALSYENYEAMITALNTMDNAVLKKGQNIYIGTVGVPDLWIYSVEESSSTYTFVDDNTLVNLLKKNVAVQIGYYKVAMLETQKVDLSGYAKTADVESVKSSKSNLLITSDFTFNLSTSSAPITNNTDYYKSFSIAKDGYTPIAIASYQLAGSYSTRFFITTNQIKGDTYYIQYRANDSTLSSTDMTVIVTILYVKS